HLTRGSSACRTFPCDEVEAEIHYSLLWLFAPQFRQRHGHCPTTYFVAGRTHACDRWEGDVHHVQIIEAGNADLPRHIYGGAVTCGKDAKRDVVVIARYRSERRHLCQRPPEQAAPERHAGRDRRRCNQARVEQTGSFHCRAVAGEPAL